MVREREMAKEPVWQIIDAGRWLDARGWAPATAGNYSVRMDLGRILVTASGAHKGRLTPADVVVVDSDGKLVEGAGRPSAETALHTALYRLDASIGAVLHVHSVNATVLSLTPPRREEVLLEGYELLKAFPGIATHEASVSVPVFDNTQDIVRLAQQVSDRWRQAPLLAYLIRGHGAYAWGATLEAALRSVEALEFLFACELERMKLPS